MKTRRLAKIGVLLLALLVSWATIGSVSAQTKQVKILIGYPPGGGHDLEARIMARHLGKYLPGKPKIIVQNMPGAGGMIMSGYVYNRAKPDGKTIGLFGSSHGIQAVLSPPDMVKYDLQKMPIIWSISGIQVHIVRDFLGANNAKEFLTKTDPSKIMLAGRSKQGSSCLRGQLALNMLGVKGYTAICAYRGTSPIKAAIERDEASFFVASDAHLVGGGAFVDLYQRGLVFPMWQSGKLKEDGTIVRSETVKGDVPTLFEVYKEVHGKEPSGLDWESWLAIGLKNSKLTRTLVLPPGTPSAKVKELRAGIAKMAKDPGFVKEWERIFGQKLAPAIVDPEEAEKIVKEVMSPSEWQAYLRKMATAS
jgi:tripartite-type tricarboxylate transporter receptor subunit TctC